MKFISKEFISILISFLCFIIHLNVNAQAQDSSKIIPEPKLVILNLDSSGYQRVFKGVPETVTFHSGLVTLKPGESVGHHNTHDYEEIIIIFSGEGQMIFDGGKKFYLKFGEVAYCPPNTGHDVTNTSSLPLKYLYVASKTK
jgi:mannose-6-phosphate isomerase-like protein (cupin superfamily)